MKKTTQLGRTGLEVGRLGISSSFMPPAYAFEEAFEKGCNYFTWGTFIKGRSTAMKRAIQQIAARGKRENLVLAMYTYAHNRLLTDLFLKKGLKALGTDYTDVLLLGYYNKMPSRRTLDGALELKEKGLVRFLGISSHTRSLFPILAREGIFDVFHIRYNAAHRGAETDIFPKLDLDNRPGIVSFTATRWKRLLSQKRMPPGETAPTAADCYRFALASPHIDVCMMGAATQQQMSENLKLLDQPTMTEQELARMRLIGDYQYKR